MSIKMTNAVRTSRADALTTAIGNAALLRFYDGTQAADANTAIGAQVLLAELTCASPFAAGASNGVLTASAITRDSSANATGTASWFRLVTSGATVIMDGSVTATGGGGDLTVVSTSFISGQPVEVSSFVITEGNS